MTFETPKGTAAVILGLKPQAVPIHKFHPLKGTTSTPVTFKGDYPPRRLLPTWVKNPLWQRNKILQPSSPHYVHIHSLLAVNNAHMELALISKRNSVLERGNIFHVKLKMDESYKLKCSIPCIIRRIQKSLSLVKVQANTSCKQFKLIEITHWSTYE